MLRVGQDFLAIVATTGAPTTAIATVATPAVITSRRVLLDFRFMLIRPPWVARRERVPNAGFKDMLELVMTAFLLIGGFGKSSRPGASTLGRGAHENGP